VRHRRGGDLPLDTFDEAIGREAVRHRDGVADGPGARSAVTDDGDVRTLPSMWPAHGGLDGFYIARLVRS